MILITGINGFVGKHLAREVYSRGLQVYGIGNNEDKVSEEITDIVVKYSKCDIANPESVKSLNLTEVSGIINLAGLANVGVSFSQPELFMKVNVDVLRVLAEEYFKQNPKGRMLAVSSGSIYDPFQSMPLKEDSDLLAEASPYALSKIAMEKEATKIRENGFDCVVARPFNHIGPGQGLGFLVPDMINKLRNIDKGKPDLVVGNIDTVRDYTDVRDIVRAYVDLITANKLNHSTYNICSGNGKSGKEIIETISQALGIDQNLNLIKDESLFRPNDPPKHIGDHKLISTDTSWEPEIQLQTTIQDIIIDTIS